MSDSSALSGQRDYPGAPAVEHPDSLFGTEALLVLVIVAIVVSVIAAQMLFMSAPAPKPSVLCGQGLKP